MFYTHMKRTILGWKKVKEKKKPFRRDCISLRVVQRYAGVVRIAEKNILRLKTSLFRSLQMKNGIPHA